MQRTMKKLHLFLPGLAVPIAAVAFAICAWSTPPQTGQRTFNTPQDAGQALLASAEADDLSALMNIFGPEGNEILNSGDTVQDQRDRKRFVQRAKQSMLEKVDRTDPARAILLIGIDSFPFPIPLVKTGGRWHFDTPAGKTEILARRIGSNELDAIASCKAYVQAQYDYSAEDRKKDGVPEFARKLISSQDKRDGLFWPASDMPETSFSSKLKRTQSEGYGKNGEQPVPYHGYYFRILTAQGSQARGGALDYVQHGLMIGGFGLVAWPVEYRTSGVKTFIVNQDGIIYEKDLGANTPAAVETLTTFNPDKTWQRVR
jgi:hypothetical protein